MQKTVKYPLLLALVGVLGYNSVFIKKLDEVNAATGPNASSRFDAATYARQFWTTKLLPATAKANELTTLLPALKADKTQTFAAHSHALGIGNIRYFLVKGTGQVKAVRDNDVVVQLPNSEQVHLATEYIYGNAARDASGLIPGTQFDNTADLNSVSEQLNAIIRQEVVTPLKAQAKPGQTVQFTGAMELNQEHLHLENLEVIPLTVTVVAPTAKP
jgi:predicted lipoprotein